MFSALLFGCWLFACLDVSAQTPKAKAERIRQVENNLITYIPIQSYPAWTLAERMKFHRVPGLTLAVIHNYRVDWVKSYGWADVAKRHPMRDDTLLSAGSISKLANAVLMMRLVQEGKLTLDQPINTFLKDWKIPENDFTRTTPPTLRMLLSHTAGTTQAAFFGFQPDQVLPTALQTLRGEAPTENRPVVVNSAPGKEFRYSGGGTLITQFAAEQVTGRAYADLIEEKVFRPLQMKSSTMRQPLPAPLAARASWAYSDAPWFTGVPYVYPQVAAAGLYSNAADIAALLIEIQNAYRGAPSKVLTQSSARAMVQPQAQISEGMFREEIGAGTFLLQLKANQSGEVGRYFGHEGRNAGFLAIALGSVTGGNGIVALINQDGPGLEFLYELRRSVAHVYGWREFLPPAVVPAKVAEDSLDRLTGRFQRGPDEVVSFRRAGQMLMQRINGGNEIICVPQSATKCFLTDFGFMGEFKLDPSGRAVSFQIPGLSNEMPRLPDDRLLPNELLRAGRVAEGVAEYRKAKLDEWGLTSMANDQMFNPPVNLPAAQGLLEMAAEQFPRSAIVNRIRGVLAEKQGNLEAARNFYREALKLNPGDDDAKRRLRKLEK